MDEFKSLNDSDNIITIANTIHKMFNSLRTSKTKSEERFHKELDLLKNLSKSDNIKVQQLVCQALLRLGESNILDLSNVVTILSSALPNSTLNQHAVIADNIIEALLIDLRRRSHEYYRCPFDIKPPQHPIILLLHKDIAHMMYLSNKISYICQHHDKSISKNSIEFLRPVLLHIFCNNTVIPETGSIWSTLLTQSLIDKTASTLVCEILSWTKTNTASHSLFTNCLLKDFMAVMLDKDEYFNIIDMLLYFVAVTKSLILFGFDPRNNFTLILQILKSTQSVDRSFYNVLLILLASMLQMVSPVFVANLLEIIVFVVTTAKNEVNFLPLYLIMDGCIQWVAHPSFAAASLSDAEFLLQQISQMQKPSFEKQISTISTSKHRSSTIYYSSEVAFYYFVACLFENISSNNDKHDFVKLTEFMEKIHLMSQEKFIKNIQFVLRGLFLCNFLDNSTWCRVCGMLLKVAAKDDCIKMSILMPFFYKLSNETDPRTRLTLLRHLASFGAKDRILKTFAVISNDIPKSLHIDLYLQIWKAEPRTYPYLHKLLVDTPKKTDEEWELDVTKAYTIKQICSLKQQHGRELVSILSDILNRCYDEKDELAASLAVDSIAILCETHVINAVSTWKVLNLKFRYEKRLKVVQSLCNFFRLVPDLTSNTADYDAFLNEIIDRLWNYVVNSDVKEVISSALRALSNFKPELMELRHIPALYRVDVGEMKRNLETDIEELDLAVEIPGDCWIQLLQKVNHAAMDNVGDLLGHYIRNEIADFRGGVYLLPEGKPEPTNLRQLPNKSVLRALVSFLIQQSSKQSRNETDLVIVQALRILAMEYSKPIPPLNWCFLHDYFHQSPQTRKHCISIAAKQMVCSGTAKRLIENYLMEFKADDVLDAEILSIFDVLPHLVKSVSTNILDEFFQHTFYFVYKNSKREAFKSGCLFEKVLTLLKPAITESCENDGNFELLFAVLDKYLHTLDINDKIFGQFAGVVCLLPTSYLEKLTSPTTWWEYDPIKFQKVTRIRSNIHMHNKSISNHMEWMNPLIDTVSDHISEQEFMVQELINLLYAYDNFTSLNVWMLQLMGRLQSMFAEKNAEHKDRCVFLLDVFMASIIVLSGCGNLVDNRETLTTSLELRLKLFPSSVQLLYSQDVFKEFDSKTYEFLYYLYHQSSVPDCYATSFKNALIACKNASYFDQPKSWTKFIAIRRL